MIAIQQMSKRFGAVEAVTELTLEIQSGETVVIQGPSGSGKTTMLRLVAGLELPDQGEIHLDGKPASVPGWGIPPYERGIGIVFQRSALWPHMNVAQNIRFGMNDISKQEAVNLLRCLLDEMALEDLSRRYPSQLSTGEARRVALARALAAKPKRLLLDEPLTSLDPQLKSLLLGVIRDHVKDIKATLLYVTHIVEEAKEVGGRLVYMDGGRLVAG